jgi:hypothetical protein
MFELRSLRRLFLYSVVWIFLSPLFGCFSNSNSKLPENFQLPSLSKEEIARIDGYPFTLSDFVIVRSFLNHPTPDLTYWVGVGSIVLSKESRNKGRPVSLQTAIRVAQYASGDLPLDFAFESLKEYYSQSLGKSEPVPHPSEVKKQIENLTHQSLVQRSAIPLTEYR